MASIKHVSQLGKRQRLTNDVTISQILDDDDDDVVMTWSLANILPGDQLEDINDAIENAVAEELINNAVAHDADDTMTDDISDEVTHETNKDANHTEWDGDRSMYNNNDGSIRQSFVCSYIKYPTMVVGLG